MLLPKGRILVSAGPRIVEIAGPERVRQLLAAPNAVAVRKRKTGAIVAILGDFTPCPAELMNTTSILNFNRSSQGIRSRARP